MRGPKGEGGSGVERNPLLSTLLGLLSIGVAFASTGLGLLVVPGLLVLGALVAFTLRPFHIEAPRLLRPQNAMAWPRELLRFAGRFVAWAAPQVPFVAPFVTFVAVTWPLAETSKSLAFQQQASELIPVLLIGFVIEAGAIRWRRQPVDWMLSLMTVAILIAGEIYAFIALATDEPSHMDVIAGSMAAGAVAILVAAIQGSAARGEEADPAG